MDSITLLQARRLALARAGLLNPAWTGMPARATGNGRRAREAAYSVVRRFGYLQLDSIPVTGARTHAIVLHSRLDGFDTSVGEELLRPGEPIFEYWAHEACWLPLELYPVFAFRRRDFRRHPWWGDIVGQNKELADEVRKRIREEGALRSADLGGPRNVLATTTRIAAALWAAGELAIPERRGFIRRFDLAERVIPDDLRRQTVPIRDAIRRLVLLSLEGHGWAELRTILDTFRLSKRRKEVVRTLRDLQEAGEVLPCVLESGDDSVDGWIRPDDLALAGRLRRVRPRPDRGVLLSPFDPVLWDRRRALRLFEFDIRIEIYKPAAKRVYGYYCLPVLAGDRLVGRVDVKADRKAGLVRILSTHYEKEPTSAADRAATASGFERFARSVGLAPAGV